MIDFLNDFKKDSFIGSNEVRTLTGHILGIVLAHKKDRDNEASGMTHIDDQQARIFERVAKSLYNANFADRELVKHEAEKRWATSEDIKVLDRIYDAALAQKKALQELGSDLPGGL